MSVYSAAILRAKETEMHSLNDPCRGNHDGDHDGAEPEPTCCGGGDFYGHEPFCDCGHVIAEKATAERMTRLEAVAEAATDCGTDVNNPDTCGVCHKHFAECEEDQFCVGDEADANDIPTGREPACPGARVRAALSGATKVGADAQPITGAEFVDAIHEAIPDAFSDLEMSDETKE